MKSQLKHEGVVVPMVTPVTDAGALDETAVDRIVEFLLAGRVNGIFVLGTTGEGSAVPQSYRQRFVERVVARVNARVLVYAGIGDLHPHDAVAGNAYLSAGTDAVVARVPKSTPAAELQPWYESLLDQLDGPMILYNIPIVTGVSIPLSVVEQLATHPQFIGIKDSECDSERLEALLRQFSKNSEVSVFVGVGSQMERGLQLGADGIVPSVGNLIPETCSRLWACAKRQDWAGAKQHAARMSSVAGLYQSGRNLEQSLVALKAALSLRGLCESHMLPPLSSIPDDQLQSIRAEMSELHLTVHGKAACHAVPASPTRAHRAYPAT